MRAIGLLLLVSSTAAAQPRDAGVPEARTDRAAVSAADAARGDAGEQPAALLARKQAEARAISDRIAELERVREAFDALPDDAVIPPPEQPELIERLGVEPADPAAVELQIAALTEEVARTRARAADVAAVEAALAGKWAGPADGGAAAADDEGGAAPEGPPDAGPPAPPDAADIERARLAVIRLERVELERTADLLAAIARYLARTQPARREARLDPDELEQRATIAQERETAAQVEREAAVAHERAVAEQRRARSATESSLGQERAALEAVRVAQARYQRWLVAQKSMLVSARERHAHELARLARELDAAPAPGTHRDLQYDRVVALLDRARADALDDTMTVLSGVRTPPAPPARLSRALRELPDDYAAELRRLEALRTELSGQARALLAEAERVFRARARVRGDHADQLNALRIALIDDLSPARGRALRGFTGAAARAMQGEAVHAALGALGWLATRTHQLRDAAHLAVDVGALGSLLWWIVESAFILLVVLRFALRRWDRWMLAIVDAVGSSMPLGGWTMAIARLADFARSFGPSLLVMLTALLLRARLGGAGAPPEVRLAFLFVFWMAAFRFQLRLVQRMIAHLAARAADRARAARELYEPGSEHDAANADAAAGEADANTDAGEAEGTDRDGQPGSARADAAHAARTPPPTPAHPIAIAPLDPDAFGGAAERTAGDDANTADQARAARRQLLEVRDMLARSWRIATGYVAVVVIVRAVIAFAAGAGVVHALVGRVAWWGAVALAIAGLYAWRPYIARELARRASDAPGNAPGSLAAWVERHGERFYGVAVVAVAVVVVVARQIARFARDSLSDRAASKRLFAFLLRRRVEKHAQEHGRMLDRPHALPAEITAEFPAGSLEPADRPVRPAFLDEIRASFAAWREDRVEGSTVLVGGPGMGKSTTLRMLERELGVPVGHARAAIKYTRPDEWMAELGRALRLPGEPRSEGDVLEALRELPADHPRVFAVDDCHNLFLRRVGGFDAWHAFTRVVNETCRDVFWVLAIGDGPWDYLDNASGRVAYFRRVIRMPEWTDEALRRLILTRMRRARYRPNFTDLLVTRFDGVAVSTQIIRTAQGYFRLLWDFTDGNPRVAGHYWLRSLVPDPERRTARVHLFASPRLADLERLPDDIAFVLAAVVEHDNLTADELALASNQPLAFCRFALGYADERGFLTRSERSWRYRLSTHWQQSIVRFLKRKHLLYS